MKKVLLIGFAFFCMLVTTNAEEGRKSGWVHQPVFNSKGVPMRYVMVPGEETATPLLSSTIQADRSDDGVKGMVAEMVDGQLVTRKMTDIELAKRHRARAEANTHIFTSYTVEGVAMTFMVLDETAKTCQVGTGEGNSAGSGDAAIERDYAGTVTIPAQANGYTVTTIGNGAFYYCTKLQGVTIPTTVERINFYAFGYCESMTQLHIPNSVTDIDQLLLCNCTSLEQITVDPENTSYDSRENCNALIETKGSYVVAGCKNTVIPETVKGFYNASFRGCLGLTQVYIPASVSWVGGQAFNSSYNLMSIKVDPNNPYLDSRDDCNAIVRTADNTIVTGCAATVIPETVTGIGSSAFAGHEKIETMTFHKNMTSIGDRAFEACPNLLKVVAWMAAPFAITNNTFTVYYGQFNSDATLYVPKGTKTAYQNTQGWSLFTKMLEMNEGPDDIVDDEDEFTAETVEGISMKFKVLDRDAKTCQVGWNTGFNISSEFSCVDVNTTGVVTIPETAKGYRVVQIGVSAFYYLPKVTQINIPNTVESINDFGISYLHAMKALYLPASVTSLSNYAFGDPVGRTTITVDPANPVYDSRDNCNAIIETATNTLVAGCAVTAIPNTVTAIGHAPFYGCTDAKSFVLPTSVASIGSQAFSYCRNLETLTVEEGNPVYDSRDNCNAIIETATNKFAKGAGLSTIPESVVIIGYDAIEGNNLLEKITIPAGVTAIENYAFEYCYNLNQVSSLIKQPFEISESVFNQGSNKYPEYLYVPAGTKALYQATPAWNRFTNIVESGSDAQIDIEPLPSNESDFANSMVDEDGDAVDLSNTEVDDVLFTLNQENGDGYDVTEGCVVVNTPMTDEAVDALDMSLVGTDEFAEQFTGLVFAITAGSGSISINLQTLGQNALSVKIGGGAAIKIQHPNRNTVVINYNVEIDTYVLVYVRANDEMLTRAMTGNNSVKIYSVAWERTGDYCDGIGSVSHSESTISAVYSLDGRRLQQPQSGVNIVRSTEGKSRKYMMK